MSGLGRGSSPLEITHDALDLLQSRLQVLGNLSGKDVRIKKACRILQTLVSEPREIETRLISCREFVRQVGPPAHLANSYHVSRYNTNTGG